MRRLILWLAVSAVGPGFATAASPKIIYSKLFKGSVPPFVMITIEKTGHAVYNEAKEDPPLAFNLNDREAAEIFDLAAKLDWFERPLESGLKVANMGLKTFRVENGKKISEVKFNFSQDVDARALADWFERITETERHLIDLDRTTHFDKLGVNQVLLQLQITYERKRLVAPEQFLPLLDRVAKNESFLHMARERAASLADSFRSSKPKAE